MSVGLVVPQNSSFTTAQQTAVTSTGSAKNDFWQSRMIQNGRCGLTTAEVTRFSFRFLGMVAVGAGIGVATAAALGVVAGSTGLLAIPCALGAAGAVWYSFQFGDYENPEELAKFREDASHMSLEQVMQTYGWNNVLHWGIITANQFTDKFRQQMQGKKLIEIMSSYENGLRHLAQCPYRRFDYQIPTPFTWRGEWRTETSAKTFEEIIQTYPLDKLEKYHLLEAGEMHCIKDLKRDYDGIKSHYATQVTQIEREFQRNTEAYQRTYQSASARADQLYNDNWAVQRLKVFEFDYIRERQVVHETANRRKNEARSRFERSVATITNNGRVLYDRLPPRDKIVYNRQNQEMQISVMQAENEGRLQIANIDSRCITERSRLNIEEARIRGERVQMTNEAKGHYDAAVASHLQNKERAVAPIEAAFRSSVNDLNGRYRAYLRRAGVIH